VSVINMRIKEMGILLKWICSVGVQPFYGKESRPLLWAGLHSIPFVF